MTDIRNQEPFKSLLAICKSPATAYSYHWDLVRYLKYLKEIKTDLYKVTKTQMEGYVLWLRKGGLCDRSIRRRLAPVSELYARLLDDEKIEKNPALVLKSVKFSPNKIVHRDLTREQRETVINSLKWDTEDDKITSMAILLAYHCGLRLSEVAHVKTTDFQDGILKVTGKGDKQREIPVSNEVSKHIKDFPDGNIFHIKGSAIYRHIKRKARELGFDFSTHWFRHGFCTQLIESGEALTTVSDLAGHNNIETTRRYVNTAKETKKAAIKKAF